MSTYLGSHALVSGRPAVWWGSALIWVNYIVFAVVATLILVSIVGFRSLVGVVAVPLVVLMAVVGALGFAVRFKGFPNQAREVAAGYTTLPGAHQEVDQVDPLTGRVVRLAGEPYLRARSRNARLISIVPIVIFAVITGVQLLGLGSADPRVHDRAVGFLVVIAVIVPIFVIGFLVVRAISRRNLRAAALARPGAHLFTSKRTDQFLKAMRRFDPTFADRERGVGFSMFYAVATDLEGVHLIATTWKTTESIPWSRVTTVRHGWVDETKSTRTLAVELLVSVNDGQDTPIDFIIGGTTRTRETLTDAALAAMTEYRSRSTSRS